MFFEVHIPTTDPQAQRTLHVEARSWRSALVAGMTQLNGAAPPSLEDFFVNLASDAITVTDPRRRQTIRITELDEKHVRASQTLRAVTGQHAPIAPPVTDSSASRPAPGVSQSRKALGFTDRATGTFRPIVSTEIKARVDAGEARILADTVAPSDSVINEVPDARVSRKKGPASESLRKKPAPVVAEPSGTSETALEDVFLEIMTIFEPGYTMEQAIDFCLDLATRYIPCASSGLMFAADSGDHLYFAAARGDGRKKLLKAQLSITDGIPAASLRDGIAIASATSLNPDPRHTGELATASGLTLDSMCSAPIQADNRAYGVLLLLNRSERPFFSQYEANIITYIGGQLGKYIQDQLDSTPLD